MQPLCRASPRNEKKLKKTAKFLRRYTPNDLPKIIRRPQSYPKIWRRFSKVNRTTDCDYLSDPVAWQKNLDLTAVL